jgi:alpha-glucuronidase
VLKSAPAEQIQAETIYLFAVVGALEEATTLNNTAVRKYKVKLVSRIALRMLPARANISRRKGGNIFMEYVGFNSNIHLARILSGDTPTGDAPVEEDIEVPNQVEAVLEQLFDFLQDRVGCLKCCQTH